MLSFQVEHFRRRYRQDVGTAWSPNETSLIFLDEDAIKLNTLKVSRYEIYCASEVWKYVKKCLLKHNWVMIDVLTPKIYGILMKVTFSVWINIRFNVRACV